MAWAFTLLAVWVSVVASPCFAEDPYAYFDWDVSFITAAPLGVKQQVPLSFSFLPSFLIQMIMLFFTNCFGSSL